MAKKALPKSDKMLIKEMRWAINLETGETTEEK